MENASNAILIAGTVLLAILIVSLGIYLHGRLKESSDMYVTRLDTVEIQKYNSNFEPFLNRENLTIQEVITIQGIAKQKDIGTKVYLKTIDSNTTVEITNWSEKDRSEALSMYIYLSNADAEKNLFKCTKIEYFDKGEPEEGKVSAIYFEQIL